MIKFFGRGFDSLRLHQLRIVDFFFPVSCLGCGQHGKYLCGRCLGDVKLSKPFCPYCFKPSIDGLTHFKCRKEHGLDGVRAVWKHEGVVRKAILSFKYKYATQVGNELLGEFVRELELIKSSLTQGFVLVPIPLYWYKENVRGFNQSFEIAKNISQKLGWQLNSNILSRKRFVRPQVELGRQERKNNLRNAFVVNVSESKVPDCIILVDDVFTTGSTLKEAARVLKTAGVKKVWGLTVAF